MRSEYRIAHLTSVHPRTDARILLKECVSLSNHGYTVYLVVADDKGSEEKGGVAILDVGASKGRWDRIRNAPGRVFAKARELDAEVYHLHDPELLPIGLKLKKLGKTVIFDAHEDVPKQLRGKHYLNKPAKWFVSNIFSIYEKYVCRRLDGVIAATPYIRDKFVAMGVRSIDVNNFPLLEELSQDEVVWSEKTQQVVYLGGLGRIRGIKEIVKAIDLVPSKITLTIGGNFGEPDFEKEVRSEQGWQRVDFRGWLERDGVKVALNESIAGLVTLHPIINYLDALPVKMFEYMAAGLPVVASNFPLWKEIVEANQCGVCVDPQSPDEIAGAIEYLVAHPEEAEKMGNNGRKAVLDRFNWDHEKKKLVQFYEEVNAAV